MNQLALGLGLKDAGTKKVWDKELEAWKHLAIAAALKLAREGFEFTIEDIYIKVGKPPRHFNSAGALLARLVAKGAPIEWTGRVIRSTIPSRHAALIRVWRGKEERSFGS